VPGIAGTVDDSDIVRFEGALGDATTGTFSLYFDGSDVGLTASDHDVDAARAAPGRADSHLDHGIRRRLGRQPRRLNEDVDAAALDASGTIYLSTLDAFAVSLP
jgi:hypothetical protein